MQQRHIPGLALAVCYRGRILKEKGYGVADVQHQSPVTPETVFELASITKQFTASAIMLLVQEGKVVNWTKASIPTCPMHRNTGGGITVRHLLTPHFPDCPTWRTASPASTIPRLALSALTFRREKGYRAARTDSLRSAPGEQYTYSDVGYFFVGD